MGIIDTIRRRRGADSRGRSGRVQAIWNGTVIAESDQTLLVEGNHYFPPESVKREHLEPSAAHTTCFWKGRASYYDVVVDGERNPAGAWYYPEPTAEAAHIRDHIAFWHGVRVRPAPPERDAVESSQTTLGSHSHEPNPREQRYTEASKVIALTEGNFHQELLDSEVPVLVDYWADWCRPCHALAPVIEDLARDYAGSLKVGKVDIDSEPELAFQAGVVSIPYVVLYRRGEPIAASVGARSKAALARALGLDAELDRVA